MKRELKGQHAVSEQSIKAFDRISWRENWKQAFRAPRLSRCPSENLMKRELKVFLSFVNHRFHRAWESHEERIERINSSVINSYINFESHEERIESSDGHRYVYYLDLNESHEERIESRGWWRAWRWTEMNLMKRELKAGGTSVGHPLVTAGTLNLMKRELKVYRLPCWPSWLSPRNLMKRELKVEPAALRVMTFSSRISWRENWKTVGSHNPPVTPSHQNLMKRELKGLRNWKGHNSGGVNESHEERIERVLTYNSVDAYVQENLMKRELKVNGCRISSRRSRALESHEERIERGCSPPDDPHSCEANLMKRELKAQS